MLGNKKREKVWNSLISGLGQIGDKGAAEKVSRYVTDSEERRRLAAISALGELADTTTIPSLILGLDDRLFTVRSAVVGSLSRFGNSAVYDLKNYISDDISLYPEIAIRILGRIIEKNKDDASIQQGKARYEAVLMFEQNLSHPSEQIRAASIDALYRNSGKVTRQMIEARMETEYSPVVKTSYEKVTQEMGVE